MASYAPGEVTVAGGERPEQVNASFPTHNLLQVLRVAPALGRDFSKEDEILAGPELPTVHVIVSHGLWQRSLGGDGSDRARDID